RKRHSVKPARPAACTPWVGGGIIARGEETTIMGPITIVFGVLLILLGLGGFIGTGAEHVTALIPTFIGLPLVLLGVLALKETLRKHAMHAAAVLGLVGFLGGAIWGGKDVPAVIEGTAPKPAAAVESLIMALICAVFVGLCVRSFVVARLMRSKAAPVPPTPPSTP